MCVKSLTRSQAVDSTASQHLWGHVTSLVM